MSRSKTIIIAVVAFIALGTIGVASMLTSRHSKPAIAVASSPIDKAIVTHKAKLAKKPKDPKALILLCQDYLQKVRETADPQYYLKCDDLLKTAVSVDANNAEVIATQSSLAYGRHDFNAGLVLAQKAATINPTRVAYLGLLGDGQIELGQYSQAIASYQKMVNKRPDLSSFNRVAYVDEIFGDIAGAESALQRAITAGSSFPENVAYSQVELGKLYARTDLDKADQTYRQALATYKDYPPALEGLGKTAFGRKDYATALKYFQQASDILPLAQYASDLADTYTMGSNKNKAAQQYYLADLAFQKSATGGINNDFEKAVYLTNHGRDLSTANALAKKAAINRPNIFSFDALAWNYYKMGDYAQAQSNIQEALKQGASVPVVLYHAGMIAAKIGQTDDAKSYLQKAFAADNYFLESHFSLLDRKLGEEALGQL